MRLITLGSTDASRAEVLSGISAGESIVSAPERVRDGVTVRSGATSDHPAQVSLEYPRVALDLRGATYHWSKHLEFAKFLDVPRRTEAPFELAVSHLDDLDSLVAERGVSIGVIAILVFIAAERRACRENLWKPHLFAKTWDHYRSKVE